MDDPLVPPGTAAIHACRRTADAQEEEMGDGGTCCSPDRSKLKTAPTKMLSLVLIVCGVLSIVLGIAARVMDCAFSEVGSPIIAGFVLVATGSIGMMVRQHGTLTTVFRCFCFSSLLCSFVIVVLMMAVLPERETTKENVCLNYDCKYAVNNCCGYGNKYVLQWEKISVDLAILIVGVVAMVTSLIASTLSLYDVDWFQLCNLKYKMLVPSSQGETATGVKTCWAPCSGRGYRNTLTCFTVAHIVIGIASIALGTIAVVAGCLYAHVAVPIWSGILIFCTTGTFGLLYIKRKGCYAPCFLALSMLSLLFSINMMFFSIAELGEGESFKYGCTEWGCPPRTVIQGYRYRACTGCLPGCCTMGWLNKAAYDRQVLIAQFLIVVAILEILISIMTFGFAFNQLTCYRCCTCSCRSPPTHDQYAVVMTLEGNVVVQSQSDDPNQMMGEPPLMVQQVVSEEPPGTEQANNTSAEEPSTANDAST